MFLINLILSSVVALFSSEKLGKKIIVPILIFTLALFAGTRMWNVSADYGLYSDYFYLALKDRKYFSNYGIMELSVYLIPNLIHIFIDSIKNTINLSFLLFAFFGVGTKLKALQDRHYFFLGLFLYLCNLYLIQEFTTIRAGVASGIFLMSIKDITQKNDKGFLWKMALAMLFHYSSIVFVFGWLLLKFKTSFKIYYLILAASVVVSFTKINLLTLLFLDRIFPKVKIYLDIMEREGEAKLNVFNFKIIIALTVALLFLAFLKKFKDNRDFEVLLKFHLLSLILFFALSPTAMTFSLRTFELLSVLQLFLYPMILDVFNKKFRFVGFIMVIVIGLLHFYYLLEISKIFKPYASWLI